MTINQANLSDLDDVDCAPKRKNINNHRDQTKDLGLACFIKKLSNWIILQDSENEELISSPNHFKFLKAGEILSVAQQEKYPIAILKSGIAYSFTDLVNGERHISSIYYPGDLLTYDNYRTGRIIHEFSAATAIELALLSTKQFDNMLERCPQLEQIISHLETARMFFMMDRYAASMRLDAHHKVIYLLLEMKACEELTTDSEYNRVELFFTQEELADMLGLTSVYVSKVLTKLEDEGIIYRNKREIRFIDRSECEWETGFINRYQQVKGWKRPPSSTRRKSRSALGNRG